MKLNSLNSLHCLHFILIAGVSANVVLQDYFDFGPGVEGRESIEVGDPIAGLAPQIGVLTWAAAGIEGFAAHFAGSSGEGQGNLLFGGGEAGNTRLVIPLTPKGVVTATAVADFSSSRNVSTLAFGFYGSEPKSLLLIGQTSDNVYARFRVNLDTGAIGPVLWGNVDGNAMVREGSTADFNFLNGDRLKIVLAIDMNERTFSLTVENLARSSPVITQTSSWVGEPDWSVLTFQQSGVSSIVLHEITVEGADIVLPEVWANYEIVDGVVNTGGFLGQLGIGETAWVHSEWMDRYLYLPEEFVLDQGAWAFLPDHFPTVSATMGDSELWAGYPINGDIVNADGLLGPMYLGHEPWVYSFALERFVYVHRDPDTPRGIWLYFLR